MDCYSNLELQRRWRRLGFPCPLGPSWYQMQSILLELLRQRRSPQARGILFEGHSRPYGVWPSV